MAESHGATDSNTHDDSPARHWNGAWHPDPKPQWIIPLKGRWWVRAMDGTRVEMGPGDILFGEDQNVRPMEDGPYAARKAMMPEMSVMMR